MKKIILFGVLLAALVAPMAHAQNESITAVKAFIEQLVDLSTGTQPKEKIKEASAKVDFQGLAQKGFGPARWKSFKAADRTDFLNTFQDLLETVAYPKAKKISTQKDSLQYQAVAGKTSQVKVLGDIEREKKGELVKQKMEVVLQVSPSSQKIVDAVIDGELLSANLRRQFDAALKKKTFGQLIAQMKKRVADAKTGPGAKSGT